MIYLKDKKVCFMGTPEFAVPVLEALIKNTENGDIETEITLNENIVAPIQTGDTLGKVSISCNSTW